jgi:hypothetical protein
MATADYKTRHALQGLHHEQKYTEIPIAVEMSYGPDFYRLVNFLDKENGGAPFP